MGEDAVWGTGGRQSGARTADSLGHGGEDAVWGTADGQLGKRLVEPHDDRAHAFDGHRQLVLVMF